MPAGPVSNRRDRVMLAADGCVITAGAFAAMIGAAFGLDALGVAPLAEPGGNGLDLFLSTISWLLQVGGLLLGPIIVWRLHDRRLDRTAIIAGIAGFAIGGALVMPVAMLGAFFDWFVGLFTTTQFVGAIGYLVLLVLAFLVATVWADVDAFRDLSAAHRSHVRLDVGRLVATAAAAVFAGIVIAMMFAGEDAVEALAFLLLAAFLGAAVVTIADLVVRLIENRVDRQAAAGI